MSTFASNAAKLVQRVQQGLAKVELVHQSHERWPLPVSPSAGKAPDILRISVLDSSFNPPTRAHLALANLPIPPHQESPQATDDYDAHLLLLSVRNVDKTLKSSDASYIQRLEMMKLLESEVGQAQAVNPNSPPNFAVAVLDEPTFVGKASILLDFLHYRLSTFLPPDPAPMLIATRPHVELTFVVGFDTLERLFAPRYYDSEQAMEHALSDFFSPNEHDCRILCAHRSMQGLSTAKAGDVEERHNTTINTARRITEPERVVIVDIGQQEQAMSSTRVRERLKQQDSGWKKLVTSKVADYIEGQGLYELNEDQPCNMVLGT